MKNGFWERNMIAIPEAWMFVAGITVQALGLASVAVARLTSPGPNQKLSQRMFFGCLCGVAGVALANLGMGDEMWLSSGVTFSLMVLGAVVDFGAEPTAESVA